MKKNLLNSSFSAVLFCLLFCVSTFSQEAQKIDEFERVTCDDYLSRMDNMIDQAQNNPSSTVYILVYEGKVKIYNELNNKTRIFLPVFGQTKAKIVSMKKYLARKKSSIDKFIFVEAGFRESPVVEFWLVPPGAIPPKPAPTLTKMKYRKGKTKEFCVEFPG